MDYAKIYCKDKGNNDGLNQILFNESIDGMRNIINFSEIEDMTVVVQVVRQFNNSEPQHNVAFVLASSPTAENFYGEEDKNSTIDHAKLRTTSNEVPADFCCHTKDGILGDGYMKRLSGRFMVKVCCILDDNPDTLSKASLKEIIKLSEELFQVYWELLTDKEHREGIYEINIKD
jgi:hypothetical protein